MFDQVLSFSLAPGTFYKKEKKKATIRNVRERERKKSVRRRILVIYKNKWCFRERLSALGFLSTCSFPLGAGGPKPGPLRPE